MWQRISKQIETYTNVFALQDAKLSSLGSKSVKTGFFFKGFEVKRFPDGELKVRQRNIGNFFSETGFVSMEQIVDCEAIGSHKLKKEKEAFNAVLTSHSLPLFIFHKQLEKLDKMHVHHTTRQDNHLEMSCNQLRSFDCIFSIPVDDVDKCGNTPLMKTVCDDEDTSACSFLLKAGAEVNAKNKDGESALTIAVAYGNIKMAELLLIHGADIDNKDRDGFTPLMRAVFSGDFELVEVLLKNGASLNLKDNRGLTALNCAASRGASKSLELLLQYGADIAIPDCDGKTALINAAEMGQTDCAEHLLNSGAQIDGQDKSGKTALHYAVIRNKSESVKLLLSQGAKVNIPDRSDCTVLYHAAESPKENHFITLLLQKGAGIEGCRMSPLKVAVETAVYTGNVKPLKLLIERYPKVNIHDHLSWQDLMWTPFSGSGSGNDKCLRVLVNCGIDINVKDKDGCTLLLIAARAGNSKAVDFLLKNGADVEVNAQSKKGLTALNFATINGDVESLQLLLQHGAKLDLQTQNGLTALDNAIIRGNAESVKLLLERGAKTSKINERLMLHSAIQLRNFDVIEVILQRCLDTNLKDDDGNTPLGLAIERHLHPVIVEMLINKGADINLQNNMGCTPLMLATTHNVHRLVKALLDKGADSSIKNNNGRTPLEEAIHPSVFKLLKGK